MKIKKLHGLVALIFISVSYTPAQGNNVVLGYNSASISLSYAPEYYIGDPNSESFGLSLDMNFKGDDSNFAYGFGLAFDSPEEYDTVNSLYGNVSYVLELNDKLHINAGVVLGYAYASATYWEDRHTIFGEHYYEEVTYFGDDAIYAVPHIDVRYAVTDRIELSTGFYYQTEVSGGVEELYTIPFGVNYAVSEKFGIGLGVLLLEGDLHSYGLSFGYYF